MSDVIGSSPVMLGGPRRSGKSPPQKRTASTVAISSIRSITSGSCAPGDGMRSVDDKARHPIDAQPVRPQVVAVNPLRLGVGGQKASHPNRVHAARRGDRDQYPVVTDVVPIGEMRREQRLHQVVRPPVARRIPHQPMGIDRGTACAGCGRSGTPALHAGPLR